jgi:hypothetical protein
MGSLTSFDGDHIPEPPFGPASQRIYDELLVRCRANLRRLRTVQFDPETGIRRYFFNGKIEGTEKVRGVNWKQP